MLRNGYLSAAVCCLPALMAAAAQAETANVRFVRQDELVLVGREVPPGQGPVEAAVRALVAGPTAEEAAAGISSCIPAGTTLESLVVEGSTIAVDLSPAVLTGLDEFRLQQIFGQFRTTLGDFPDLLGIRLTCKGNLLASYLPLAPVIEPAAPAIEPTPAVQGAGPLAATALSGRNITIGPSHGRFWNGSGWYWQRSDPCGFGEAVLEDTNSIRLMQFLYQYLAQDGATVHVPRELNESNCCHSSTGLPWWKMAARYWLQANGIPSSVWNSSDTDLNDDIRCRPLYADYRGSHIYIAHHTNAGGGGTANGTETYRDTAMQYPAHESASLALATAINNNIVSAIRNMYDSGWSNRGVKDSTGNFGEIRIPNRPACLIELAFHDNCSRDAQYLTDNFFRSVAEWGLYKGVCEYFGVTPTWDKYSDEYVSDTIPTTMTQGQVYNVSVVFRNRGVVWSAGRSFRLGAVGDSDPFTSFNRVNLSGEVRPGSTYTFTFQMTAPAPGDYVSDWRMVRDGVAWFGATLTRNIHVNPNVVDNDPPTTPTNLTATATGPTSVQLNWTASTDNIGVTGYHVRRNGVIINQSASNSFTDNSCSPGTAYIYEVRAFDAAGNLSDFSNPAGATTPTGPVLVFSDGFDGNLNNWVQQSQNFDYSTAANHGTYTGSGSAYLSAGGTDQMYHTFSRPFAQGKVSGWFRDPKGGYKSGVCGNGYRQSLSLRAGDGSSAFIVDNCLASNLNNAYYYYRTVGGGGVGYTQYATRNPNTDCNPAWIYFETTVTPGAIGASPTGSILLKVTDGAGTTTATTNLTTDFFSVGIGRITLGLGVSSAGEGCWDDIALEAIPPAQPGIGTPVAVSNSQIRWNFTPADSNLFGYEVADAGGGLVSPQYNATGWLNRTATSWTESGLAANTQYTRKVRAWNGTLNGSYSAAVSAHTLSVPPGAGTIVADQSGVCPGYSVTWTATTGFGPGVVQYYRYAWDQSPTHVFDGSEPVWSEGALTLWVTDSGPWYLHVQGYNGEDLPNGVFDYTIGPPQLARPDFDRDGDVDMEDYGHLQACLTASGAVQADPDCMNARLDPDEDVDQSDLSFFMACLTGANLPADPCCGE